MSRVALVVAGSVGFILAACGARSSLEDGLVIFDEGDAGEDASAPDDGGGDAVAEAGRDGGHDAGLDGGADAGHDAEADGGSDAGHDGGADSGHDASVDSGDDAGLDAGSDGGVDSGVDAGFDAGGDAGLDAGDDAGEDSGVACASLAFTGGGTQVPGASTFGLQDIPAGVTPSGSTILVQRGTCSNGLSLYVADEVSPGSGTYQTRAVPFLPAVDTGFEEAVTLEADGLTIIALTPTRAGFVTLARSAMGQVDFAATPGNDFAQITAMGSQLLWAPAMSPDGLAFYYTVQGDPSAAINGIYESVRASASVPFPPGTRMPPLVQGTAQYVNGLSSDRLAIFLEESTVFGTAVLTRATVTAPFTNPLAPSPPPTVPGLRSRPLAGCARLIGTCSPSGGGCSGEDVCAWGSP